MYIRYCLESRKPSESKSIGCVWCVLIGGGFYDMQYLLWFYCSDDQLGYLDLKFVRRNKVLMMAVIFLDSFVPLRVTALLQTKPQIIVLYW